MPTVGQVDVQTATQSQTFDTKDKSQPITIYQCSKVHTALQAVLQLNNLLEVLRILHHILLRRPR